MLQTKVKIHHKPKHLEKINNTLTGYWSNDIWDVNSCPVVSKEQSYEIKVKKINVGLTTNPFIKDEIKFFLANRLSDRILRPSTVWGGYTTGIKVF